MLRLILLELIIFTQIFAYKFDVLFWVFLNIIQNDDIEKPEILGVKGLIREIEKKTNFQLLLRNPE